MELGKVFAVFEFCAKLTTTAMLFAGVGYISFAAARGVPEVVGLCAGCIAASWYWTGGKPRVSI